MAGVNGVNGNGNGNNVNAAAEAAKKAAEKAAAAANTTQAANSSSNANANASDSVQISTAAQTASNANANSSSNNSNSNANANANNNASSNANTNSSSSSNDNETSSSLSKKRSYSRYSRTNSHNQNDRTAKADKAEKAAKADKAEKTHGTRRDQKVEKTSKQISAKEKVSNRDHKIGSKRAGRSFDSNMLKAKTEKLSTVFKGLSKMGISAKDVSKIVQKANRNINESLGKDLKQAYTDYKDKKITSEEFKSKLYETAIKKVQGIASALRGVYSQNTASTGKDNGSMTPSFGNSANKANSGSTTPSFAAKANGNGSTQAPRESIFAKKESSVATPTPQKSIFEKTDSAKSSPSPLEKAIANKGNDKPSLVDEAAEKDGKTAMSAKPAKDETSIVDKATAENKEKSEDAKAAAKTDEKTAMAAKPAIAADAKITEKKGNIAENVGDHLTTTTEKTVENSALKTGVVKVKDDDDNDDDDKKVAPGLAKKEEGALPPGLAKKEEGVVPPGLAKKDDDDKKVPPGQAKNDDALSKLEKELKKMLDDIIKVAEKLPPGLAKKDELPGNADKAFGEIVGMFNEIDKMVNSLDDKDKDKGFAGFVNGLSKMFNGGKTQGNDFLKNLNKVVDEHGASDAQKVGMAQIKADTLSSLFNGGNKDSAFGINRVGDNGEGSGNFSAVNFMSDMSKNIDNGLDSYKDAKEAREEAGVNTANEAKQVNAEAEVSVLA